MKYLTTLLAAAALLTSCAGPHYLSTATEVDALRDLAYFPSYSYISNIAKGNRAVPSDSLSAVTQHRLDSLVDKHSKMLRMSDRLVLDDPTTAARVEEEINYLARNGMVKPKHLATVRLPRTVDSLLESSGHRYGVAIIAAGFGRRRGNYGGQIAKGVAVGILTLGMYMPVPIKSNLTLYTVILDAERDEVVFYNRTAPVEKEPTEGLVIERELMGVWEGWFWGAGK